MTPRELKTRTEKFSNTIVEFCTPLLDAVKPRDIARQLLRAGTAVDSNYGSAQRGRSHDEFTSRIGVVWDEAAESNEWLRKLQHGRLVPASALFKYLLRESEELTKIFAAAHRTAKAEQARRKAEKRRARRNRGRDDQ